MSVDGKGVFVGSTKRPRFQGVKFHVIGIKGRVVESVINATDIQYIDSDRRDGSTLVILKDKAIVHVTEKVHEAANQWGQRENVVKYKRQHDDDRLLEVVLRVDDITGIDISTRDKFTVIVKSKFAVFPVVGKHETIIDRSSYCRPFAVFHKITEIGPLPSAVPIDQIVGVETSYGDDTTLVKTQIGRLPITESVDETMAIIDKTANEFEAAIAAAEAGEAQG